MYTTYPLETINMLNNHSGFYLILAVTLIMFCIFCICEINDDGLTLKGFSIAIMTATIAISGSGYISWHSGDYKVYKNEKVVGKFVGYVPEGYITRETSGKVTKDVAHHYVYVQYKIEDRYVLFYALEGQSWPPEGVFYKN